VGSIMRNLYVIDTNAVISFFDGVFRYSNKYNKLQPLSNNVMINIKEALFSRETSIRLSIPTVVFIEIYEKWLMSEEFCRRFFYEVFQPITQSPNIEIRPIDREVLENLLEIGGTMEEHDLHDRLILASAMALNAPLITTDRTIIRYIRNTKIVPSAYN